VLDHVSKQVLTLITAPESQERRTMIVAQRDVFQFLSEMTD